jgi:putative DNA primase/helicase
MPRDKTPAEAIRDGLAAIEDEVPRPPEFSDESLALRFADRHKDRLRYVAAWGRWLEWDGKRWKFEDTLHALDLARAVCREASAECNKEKLAMAVASAKTVAAVERLAKADRRLAATVDQWDANIWLLGTPGGTIDLATGKLRDARQDDYITKTTAVMPGGACPKWRKFLKRITADNESLEKFLQRKSGYALTGSTRDHALFIGHGTGANGKGVYIGATSGAMGDYAVTAPMETFIVSKSDRDPTELAGLRGARLVTATETEEGRRWNESRVKALTGGDKISARFMRQDFFEFVPQFKLLIVGNHKPQLRSVDEAIRRRMNLIPFLVTIPESERDPNLPEILKEEWPGILQWMIEGCAMWLKDGLAPPDIVRTATRKYLEAEDAISQWLAERCDIESKNLVTLSTHLFNDWKAWATAVGEFVGSQKRFSQALLDRGFIPGLEGGTGRATFNEIRLRPPPGASGGGDGDGARGEGEPNVSAGPPQGWEQAHPFQGEPEEPV